MSDQRGLSLFSHYLHSNRFSELDEILEIVVDYIELDRAEKDGSYYDEDDPELATRIYLNARLGLMKKLSAKVEDSEMYDTYPWDGTESHEDAIWRLLSTYNPEWAEN